MRESFRQWKNILQQIPNPLIDPNHHIGVVHGVEVHTVGAGFDEIPELADGVVDARLIQAVGIVLPLVQQRPEGGGDAGAGEGQGAVDLALTDDGHDAGGDGQVDALLADEGHVTVEVEVVKEHLGAQVGGAGLLLDLQHLHIRPEGGTLRVLLRIAGAGEAEGAVMAPDKGGQIAGVVEVGELLDVGVPVAPEDHQIAHPGGKELIQAVLNARPVGPHTGQVGQGLNIQLIFQVGGHLAGGDAAGAGAAGGAGDADKVGMNRLHLLQGLLKGLPLQLLLGGEELHRKDAAFPGKNLADVHKTTSSVGNNWVQYSGIEPKMQADPGQI